MQNKVNLELKYFCKDFAALRRTLREIGAKKVGTFAQKDYFFNLPLPKEKVEPRLKLRIQKGTQTLIYYKRPDFSQKQATSADIILLKVKDKKLLPFLQKTLGVKAVVSKKRELWKKENTVFHLDKVRGIGKIFEIESTIQGNRKIAEKIFNQYKKKLLSHLQQIIKASNLDLIVKQIT